MAAASTSIQDLPTDPTMGGSVSGNVSMPPQPMMPQTPQYQTMPPLPSQAAQMQQQIQPSSSAAASTSAPSLDQNTISQIVNGIQQAHITGATSLPSRDIALTTQEFTSDPYVQPNYVPAPSQSQQPNYVQYANRTAQQEYDASTQGNKNALLTEQNMETFYDLVRIPLLVAILYFIFQLPILKGTLHSYTSFLFLSDGNYNLYGFMFVSALFGFCYYLMQSTGIVRI